MSLSLSLSSVSAEAQGGQEGKVVAGGTEEEGAGGIAPPEGGGVDLLHRAWVAHIAMGLAAFGLLTPAAISSAVLRDLN